MTEELREALVEMIPHLRAFARSLTGGDREFADDLVQDTLVKSMAAAQQFQQGTNLRAWLFTILRNTFCSQLGRKRRHVSMEDEDLERLATTAAPQEGRLEAVAFRRAFKQLSAVHREVLVLSVIQGMPYEAIAARCGCEVGTVKSRVNRARAQLKAMLLDGGLPMQPRPKASQPRAPLAEESPLPAKAGGRHRRDPAPAAPPRLAVQH
jgi:RNA polymerase sigma-70 factor, ECF subfamily